ncbi:hypothetical protein SAMN04488020_12020 [Palleronia marisminoris]|uniref:Ternary complex associated domain-containing protein n=1 Tax=Palleronia marisminoris TaxID=315423 RepID=A0A1Y5TYK0_9RHOB|nr:hypothetical protein [Palleronia marisminoris]SFH52779.1 hypothetical protein SAMN04488020_12020 [Palleronia marisminoris]SLN71643.1 hypothetical protein PAM7066_03680 [Palleronia marisminoris]
MLNKIELVSEMLHPETEAALKGALERFYECEQIAEIWPSAEHNGVRLPLHEVRVVVLPLDRIGAPAGASGAGVYVAYYSHNVGEAERRSPSQPLVAKIGPPRKLCEEKEGADGWPKLTRSQKGKFAFPIYYDATEAAANRAVLLAPFQSRSQPTHGGSRNDVEVRDLWHLLDSKTELLRPDAVDWDKVSKLIAQALDAMEPPHQGGRGRPPATNAAYADHYEKYLRKTTKDCEGSRSYMLSALFGEAQTTRAFGTCWPNPTLIIQRIIEQRTSAPVVLGPVHGDLHPKNIVLDTSDSVQIIDFGWAAAERPIVLDYLLLDLNLRGTTLPSQISEEDMLKLAGFLRDSHDACGLPVAVRKRAEIIRDVIWRKAQERVVRNDWEREYMIPLFLVGYGLLVHLDSARNQVALIATVLQLALEIDRIVPQGSSA